MQFEVAVYVELGLLSVKFDFKRVTVESDALVVATVCKGLEKHSTSCLLYVAPDEGRMEKEIW